MTGTLQKSHFFNVFHLWCFSSTDSQKSKLFVQKWKNKSFTIALRDTFRQKTRTNPCFSSNHALKILGSILIKKRKKENLQLKNVVTKMHVFHVSSALSTPPPKSRETLKFLNFWPLLLSCVTKPRQLWCTWHFYPAQKKLWDKQKNWDNEEP